MFVDIEIPHRYLKIDEIIPYAQYGAGTRSEESPVYKSPTEQTSNPILTLEFDILNKDGFGLKRGYYEIGVTPDYSALIFIEAGQVRAKIPVIKQEAISKYGTSYEWDNKSDKNHPQMSSKDITSDIQVASRQIYKPQYTEKELKERQKKYKKGQDPSYYFHSKVTMEYDSELQAYKVVWEKYNTRLIGIIKL